MFLTNLAYNTGDLIYRVVKELLIGEIDGRCPSGLEINAAMTLSWSLSKLTIIGPVSLQSPEKRMDYLPSNGLLLVCVMSLKSLM